MIFQRNVYMYDLTWCIFDELFCSQSFGEKAHYSGKKDTICPEGKGGPLANKSPIFHQTSFHFSGWRSIVYLFAKYLLSYQLIKTVSWFSVKPILHLQYIEIITQSLFSNTASSIRLKLTLMHWICNFAFCMALFQSWFVLGGHTVFQCLF